MTMMAKLLRGPCRVRPGRNPLDRLQPAAPRMTSGSDPGGAAAPVRAAARDRVLLAVFPARDALAAYSFGVVDRALRAHVPLPGGEGRRP